MMPPASPTSPDNIASLLWSVADASPGAPAFLGAAGVVDYAALRARAGGIARRLRQAGIEPGDRVAILLPRGAETAAAWFGAAACGAIGLFVGEALRPRQIGQLLRQVGASVLLTSPASLRRQPRPLHLDASLLLLGGEHDPDWTPVARGRDAPALIVRTSGSTGMPKAVVHSHASLAACAESVSGYLGLRDTDRVASVLPFNSVYGFNQLLCAVRSGAAVVVEEAPLASTVAQRLRRAEVTVLATVPPFWMQLLQARDFSASPLPALRQMQSAGGRLPPPLIARLREVQPQAELFVQYGLTEVMRSTFLPPAELDQRPESMGRAIPGARLEVLRDDGSHCAVGEVGELVHRGPTVALGYWADEAATAEVFADRDGVRSARSGDLVRQDEAGFLYWVGRRDRLIRTMGYRVGPDEVCDVLYASGEVVEAAVGSEPDPARGERIVAHVVLRRGGTLEALEAFCRREMPHYLVPTRVVHHRRLPRLPSGKFDLLALRTQPVG